MPWSEEVKQKYSEIKDEILVSGGEKRIQKEHDKGKLTARERMNRLFDNGEFDEIEAYRKSRVDLGEVQKKHYWGDGVICGYGYVNGISVYAVSQDCMISGGAGGEAHVEKMCRTLELAIESKRPIIFLCDSGGARIEESIISLAAYSRLFYLNTKASGLIPQIAAIMGNCAGGSSYSPAMCDFVFMVQNTSQFFITGPKVIKALTGESVTMEELGGTEVHSVISGQVHRVCKNDDDCLDQIRQLIEYLEIKETKKYCETCTINYKLLGKEIEEVVSQDMRRPYDVKEVINRTVDNSSFFEILPSFAKNIVVGFARIDGKTVGIVANQPNVMGGALDCDSADKSARFVRTCDCFGIPLLVLVDVPGYYPGSKEEKKGILRHGAKLLYAFAEATVPKISVIMRKGYGGAYCAMNSKDLGADYVFAWPICEIAVMGADGAVDVMFAKQINVAENPVEFRQEKIKQYEEKYLNPYFAASYGMIDEVILPEDTREKLIKAYSSLKTEDKNRVVKKHGNISL